MSDSAALAVAEALQSRGWEQRTRKVRRLAGAPVGVTLTFERETQTLTVIILHKDEAGE